MRRTLLAFFIFFTTMMTVAGCSSGEESAPPSLPPEKTAAEKEPAVEKEPEPEPTAYVRVDDEFTNFQLDDVTKPLFDRHTLEQRIAGNLPHELPDITPYTGRKIAYLTFDDGPDDKNTPAVLDILKEHGIKGTFYLVGRMAEKYPEVVKRIFDEGHAIGNHSYNHDYYALYPDKNEFLWQISHTDEIIHRIIGVRPLIIRAPGGTWGMFTDDYWPMLKKYGYVEHDWNVSIEDATLPRPSTEQLISNLERQTRGQLKDDMALVLMHSSSGHENTVRALPEVIRILAERGYDFGVVTPMTPAPWGN